jgi:hypothetical protein
MKPHLTRILDAAIRSPSGDNCQPWAFQFPSDETIVVSTATERAKSFFDYRLHGALMSLGAVIENIRVQAAAEGFTIDVDYNGSGHEEEHAVVISLLADPNLMPEKAAVAAMLSRTVNRRPYLPLRTSEKVLGELLQGPVEGTGVSAINRWRDINRWSRVAYVADRIRYSHPLIHEELFKRLLMDRESIERERAGLEIDRLGAGPIIKPLMQLIKPWDRMTKLLRFGMDRMLASHTRLMCYLSGSLLLVSIDEDTREHWIRAGEQMQRLWVKAHQMGLCVHPVTVSLYLDHRYEAEGMAQYYPRHLALLEEIHVSLKTLLRGKIGAIVFRVGRGWPMNDTAVRLPREHFIVGESS